MLSSIPMSSPLTAQPNEGTDYFSPPAITYPDPPESSKSAENKRNYSRTQSQSPSRAASRGSGPSSLTLQLKKHSNPSSALPSRDVSPMRVESRSIVVPDMTITTPTTTSGANTPRQATDDEHRRISQHIGRLPMPDLLPTDTTPLLYQALPSYTIPSRPDSVDAHLPTRARPEARRAKSLNKRFRLAMHSSIDHAKTATKPNFWLSLLERSIAALPAVFLGLLLNILDGVSYGMILFPAGKMFEGFGAMGVSLFFVT